MSTPVRLLSSLHRARLAWVAAWIAVALNYAAPALNYALLVEHSHAPQHDMSAMDGHAGHHHGSAAPAGHHHDAGVVDASHATHDAPAAPHCPYCLDFAAGAALGFALSSIPPAVTASFAPPHQRAIALLETPAIRAALPRGPPSRIG